MTQDKRGPVRAALVHPARASNAPLLLHHALQPHIVSKGFRELNPHDGGIGIGISTASDQSLGAQDLAVAVPTSSLSSDVRVDDTSTSHTNVPNSRPPQLTSGSSSTASMPTAVQQTIAALSMARVEQIQEAQVTEKAPRKPRTCMKCGKRGGAGCSGRQSVKGCALPCQDCGKVECLGRDSKRRETQCWVVREYMVKKMAKKRKRDE
ncbi:hypothetical protein BKA70DRAFT_1227201 [Coprinopsis sp. MPI-PUGE-AT-0042]|nr:hypothetical protein BKA70DRAFT_1227199 [Coprinopsis sp. MPI-PUGE-AT-0042]KAH6903849.1 hypothetical protein BKA70DRAFT_1227201 [Coprinopsis sp. MPI-PUGE-AT-0042]